MLDECMCSKCDNCYSLKEELDITSIPYAPTIPSFHKLQIAHFQYNKCISAFKNDYCQAQPKPKLKPSCLDELVLIPIPLAADRPAFRIVLTRKIVAKSL